MQHWPFHFLALCKWFQHATLTFPSSGYVRIIFRCTKSNLAQKRNWTIENSILQMETAVGNRSAAIMAVESLAWRYSIHWILSKPQRQFFDHLKTFEWNLFFSGDPGRSARLWWQLCCSSQSQCSNSWGEKSIRLIFVMLGRNKTTITNSLKVVETPVIVPEGDIATLRIRVSGNPA